jgi:hypothetical protein
MLELRPVCENCGIDLPNETIDAYICSFECTFCIQCVNNILHNVCPNCGGGFEKRPIRPKEKLRNNPQKKEKYFNPINPQAFEILISKFRNLKPEER